MRSKPRQTPGSKNPTPAGDCEHRRCSAADLARDVAATVAGLREVRDILASYTDDLEHQGRRLAHLARRLGASRVKP